MRRRLSLAALLVCVGCGYPEAAFRDDLDAAACDWQTDCYSYQSHGACVAEAEASRTEVDDSCTYDPDAARECVRDYAAIDCPDGDEHAAAVPAACEAVWSCGGG